MIIQTDLFFSGTTLFPFKLVALDGIPPPQQYLGRQREIPTERVLGYHPGDPRRQAPVVMEVATQSMEALETAEATTQAPETTEKIPETTTQSPEKTAEAMEEAPPTPSMFHSDGDTDTEEYKVDGADGEYHPTPLQLTNEFKRLDDWLENKYDGVVDQLKEIEEERDSLREMAVAELMGTEKRRKELAEKLKANHDSRETLATELQKVGDLHQQQFEKLEKHRLSLLM